MFHEAGGIGCHFQSYHFYEVKFPFNMFTKWQNNINWELRFRTGSRAHYPWRTSPGREAGHLPTISAGIGNVWSEIFTPLRLHCIVLNLTKKTKLNSMAWVYERTIPTEGPLLVDEVSVNCCGWRCHVVSVTNPYGRNLDFLDRNRYFLFQVAPQLYPRGWVDPVPDPLPLRKSGRAGNRTCASESVGRNSDH
jgi:hypothetical protein